MQAGKRIVQQLLMPRQLCFERQENMVFELVGLYSINTLHNQNWLLFIWQYRALRAVVCKSLCVFVSVCVCVLVCSVRLFLGTNKRCGMAWHR